MKLLLSAWLLTAILSVSGPWVVVSTAKAWGGRRGEGRQVVCWAQQRGQLPPVGCATVAYRYWRVGDRIMVERDAAGRVTAIRRAR